MQFFTDWSTVINGAIRKELERLDIALHVPESDLAGWYWRSRWKMVLKSIIVFIVLYILLYGGYVSRRNLEHARWLKRETARREALATDCMQRARDHGLCGYFIRDDHPDGVNVFCDPVRDIVLFEPHAYPPKDLGQASRIRVKEQFSHICPEIEAVIVYRDAVLDVGIKEIGGHFKTIHISDPQVAACLQHFEEINRVDFTCASMLPYVIQPNHTTHHNDL